MLIRLLSLWSLTTVCLSLSRSDCRRWTSACLLFFLFLMTWVFHNHIWFGWKLGQGFRWCLSHLLINRKTTFEFFLLRLTLAQSSYWRWWYFWRLFIHKSIDFRLSSLRLGAGNLFLGRWLWFIIDASISYRFIHSLSRFLLSLWRCITLLGLLHSSRPCTASWALLSMSCHRLGLIESTLVIKAVSLLATLRLIDSRSFPLVTSWRSTLSSSCSTASTATSASCSSLWVKWSWPSAASNVWLDFV